jgi:hypothetical protein
MADQLKRAVGITLVAIADEHLMTFMLSSPFTARHIVHEKNDVAAVQQDLNIATAMSIGFSAMIGGFFQDKAVSWFGVGFSLVMWEIYRRRGQLYAA